MQWVGGLVVLSGCSSHGLEPGTAVATVTLTPSSDSSAQQTAFVIGETGVNGRPGNLEVMFIDEPTRLRVFKFNLEGPITAGTTFDRYVGYFEVPGGVPNADEQWLTDLTAPTGLLTIESADDDGFTFSLAPHLMVPNGPDATGTIVIECSGEAAYR